MEIFELWAQWKKIFLKKECQQEWGQQRFGRGSICVCLEGFVGLWIVDSLIDFWSILMAVVSLDQGVSVHKLIWKKEARKVEGAVPQPQ